MKKFKISYYYSATGMEGREDKHPEKIIEAPSKEMASFIYYLMFFGSSDIEELEKIRSYSGENISMTSFENYLKGNSKFFGLSIDEI